MKNRQHISILLTILLTVALVASGCSPKGGSTTVKELSGAGATFPYPLYSKMFDTYASTTGVRVNYNLSLIHISEPTRLGMISYAVFCLKKKTKHRNIQTADSI